MANQNDEDILSAELESRLDDLFREDEKLSDGPLKDRLAEDYPLGELKNLVLSIDWEITDEVLSNFLKQIGELKKTYNSEKINLTFLQILGALGGYIKTNRGKAHPKTFKILNSVFSRFDDVVSGKEMQESEKKSILRDEMNKYKELREQILRDKTRKIGKEGVKSAQKIIPQLQEEQLAREISATQKNDTSVKVPAKEVRVATGSDVTFSEEIVKAVEEIKKYIHAELKALREELMQVLRQE